MRLGALVAFVVALQLAIWGGADAQIPALFNYQVMLTDNDDNPLADEAVTMVFTLYDSESGGTAVWTETQTPTTNSIGVVSVVLGGITPITFDFDAPFWLEVEVSGQVLSPRRPLTASPYAGHAAGASDSDRLGGIDASEYALLDDIGAAGDGHSLDADDGSPMDALYVTSSGDVRVGEHADQRALYVGGTHVDNAAVGLEDQFQGGSVTVRDETGMLQGYLMADTSPGGGGYLSLTRNDSGNSGIVLDGNRVGNEEPRVDITGSARSAVFDMGEVETWSVQLPEDAIDRTERMDEPGVASIQAATETSLTTGSVKTVAARTIMVPNSGYVFVMGTAQLKIYNYDSGIDRFWFGVSNQQNAWSGAVQETYIELPGVLPGGWYYYQAAAQGLFQVSAGSHTFYLNVLEEHGDGWVSARQLTLMYFPTAYGTVDIDD